MRALLAGGDLPRHHRRRVQPRQPDERAPRVDVLLLQKPLGVLLLRLVELVDGGGLLGQRQVALGHQAVLELALPQLRHAGERHRAERDQHERVAEENCGWRVTGASKARGYIDGQGGGRYKSAFYLPILTGEEKGCTGARQPTARKPGALIALLCQCALTGGRWPGRLRIRRGWRKRRSAPARASPTRRGRSSANCSPTSWKTREDDLRWVAIPAFGSGHAVQLPGPPGQGAVAGGRGGPGAGRQADGRPAVRRRGHLDEERHRPRVGGPRHRGLQVARLRAGSVGRRLLPPLRGEEGADGAVSSRAAEPRLPAAGRTVPARLQARVRKRAQRRVEKAARGTLAVDGPSGSTVFLNGRDLGMVPVQQEDVPAGTQYVRVEGPHGRAVWPGRRGPDAEPSRSGPGLAAARAGARRPSPRTSCVGTTIDSDTATTGGAAVQAAPDVDFLVVAHPVAQRRPQGDRGGRAVLRAQAGVRQAPQVRRG